MALQARWHMRCWPLTMRRQTRQHNHNESLIRCAASTHDDADVTLQVTPALAQEKSGKRLRLDAFLSGQLAENVSRARIQQAIKSGHVLLNGRPCTKPAQEVKLGDTLVCSIPDPPALQALPQAIPLDVVYEDEHVLVINKGKTCQQDIAKRRCTATGTGARSWENPPNSMPSSCCEDGASDLHSQLPVQPAGMVVHPSPGHPAGTLVNAVLGHCTLAPALLKTGCGLGEDGSEGSQDSDWEDVDADDADAAGGAMAIAGNLRPGIVHRLDVGTTGLMVVAKDVPSLWKLSQQFKDRTCQRQYISITLGCPPMTEGIVEMNVGRDIRDRKRMAAYPYGGARGRTAASEYQLVQHVAGGAAAVLAWKLRTGRTHQIRVHAKHMGIPLLGDTTYGGGQSGAQAAWQRAKRAHVTQRAAQQHFIGLVEAFNRPALHAKSLGFMHPVRQEWMSFDSPLPDDMQALLTSLAEV